MFVPDAAGQRESERLVRSLSWLVSAVVSGVVRDVTVVGREGLGLADIADQCGCGFVEGSSENDRLQQAIALSRAPRVLILRSGYQPGETMICELDSMAHTLAPNASLRLLTPGAVWQRLLPRSAATIGLFAPTERCRSHPARSFSQLVAALKPKAHFATRAAPIP